MSSGCLGVVAPCTRALTCLVCICVRAWLCALIVSQEHALRAAGVFPSVLEALTQQAGAGASADDDLKLVAGTHWGVRADQDGEVSYSYL